MKYAAVLAVNYIKLLARKPFYILMLPLTTMFYLEARTLLPHPMPIELSGGFVGGLLVAFFIYALLIANMADASTVLVIKGQPVTTTPKLSFILTMANFLSMSPLIVSMLLLLSVAAASFPRTILIIYVLLLGLAISASGNAIKIPISIASSMMALFISVDLLRAIMFSLPVALLLLPIVLKLMARLPHILTVERLDFATVSPYLIVVVSIFVLLPTFLMTALDLRGSSGYISPGQFALITTQPTNILAMLLTNSIFALSFLAPALVNAYNRYVDAHIWYLKAIRGTKIRTRLLQMISNIIVGLFIPLTLFMIVDKLSAIKVYYAPLLSVAGVVAGTLTLSKLISGAEMAKVTTVYLLILACLTWVNQILPPALPDIVRVYGMIAALILVSLILYDLPIKVQSLLQFRILPWLYARRS